MDLARRSSGSAAISQPQDERLRSWVVGRLTALAEAMGESVTPERIAIYASRLCRYSSHRLDVAFTRCLEELTFFPKLAEILARLPEPPPAPREEVDWKQVEAYFDSPEFEEDRRRWRELVQKSRAGFQPTADLDARRKQLEDQAEKLREEQRT